MLKLEKRRRQEIFIKYLLRIIDEEIGLSKIRKIKDNPAILLEDGLLSGRLKLELLSRLEFPKNYEKFSQTLVSLAFSGDVKDILRKNDSSDEIHFLIENFVILSIIRKGIKIGQLTKREIGNEAVKFNLSMDEAEAFVKYVIQKVVDGIFE